MIYANLTKKKVLLIVVIALSLLHFPPARAQQANAEQLYIALLIDGSLSMRDTDPLYYRKIASQAILSLMSDNDSVSVIEFSSEPVILQNWTSAGNIHQLYASLEKIEASGTTDFYLALKKMTELFSTVPPGARKIILLFSDGALEPNPYSSEYSPLHLQYRALVRNKTQYERSLIYKDFKHRIIPIANERINSTILPQLQAQGVEIFSVAFSPISDKEYLNNLARKTSISEIEQRFFYVEQASDILETFMTMLPLWQNKVLLYKEEGIVRGNTTKGLPIDEFVKNPVCLVIADNGVAFEVTPVGLIREESLTGTHERLKIIPLENATPPYHWNFDISGNGKYKFMVVGESTIRIEVEELKPTYSFGEEINANVSIKYGERDAREVLNRIPNIVAYLFQDGNLIDSVKLSETTEGFRFRHPTDRPGFITVRFTLRALDSEGRELLPRPSRDYQFQVLPLFRILPNELNLGSVKRGTKKSFDLTVINGLEGKKELTTSIKIHSHSKKKLSEGLPQLDTTIISEPLTQTEFPFILKVPKKTRNWGYFGGDIILNGTDGKTHLIPFTLHIPSWIEKIKYVVTPLLLILLAVLIYILIRWSNLKSPVGILRIVEHPLGELKQDIRLSRIKQGFLSRHLNWKKNVVRLGTVNSNIKLRGIPANSGVELLFFRIGINYIKNDSPKDSDFTITVERADMRVKIKLRAGKPYPLSNGMIIGIGEYVLTYNLN